MDLKDSKREKNDGNQIYNTLSNFCPISDCPPSGVSPEDYNVSLLLKGGGMRQHDGRLFLFVNQLSTITRHGANAVPPSL